MRQWISLSAVVGSILWASSAPAMVITEIHYHPGDGDDALEFIELTSDTTTPQDISGFHFTEGIDYEFPAGTIVPSSGVVVVAADPDAMKARYGLEKVFGPYAGRLDNSNDRITFVNHAGAVLQSVRYRDTGKWPVAADGAGHTLVLRGVYLDSGEPESWAQSPELGGSPGRPNFPTGEPQFKVDVIVEKGAMWRYAKGTGAYSIPENAWREPGFDDLAWVEGPSGFGFADDDDATLLADMLNGYSTVAIRRKLSVTAEQVSAPGEFYLGVNYDDGFCAFLDGKEIARSNCGTPDVEVLWNSVATLRRETGAEDLFKIPAESLGAGEHTLAIIGLNFRLADNDFSLIPRVVKRALIEDGGTPHAEVVFNELRHGTGPGTGWIELYNPAPAEVSLSGYSVTDDPARKDPVKLADGTRIGPHGFLLLGEGAHPFDTSGPKVQLFLIAPDGFTTAASTFDRTPPEKPVGGPLVEWSEGRFPDGGRDGWITRTPTPGAANRVEQTTDIVINEIFYHPPEERKGEFLELYNRGSKRIDLTGFHLNRGIDFAFADGTAMEPGAYLVLAEDPALLKQDHGVDALGPYEGQLSDDGESVRLEDGLGNVAAEVRYFDGGTWPIWADGGGSSIELIDPNQDPAFAASWAASDESQKASWEQLSFHVDNYAPAAVSELHLLLLERGTCHVDDVSISRDAGANLIPNPDFEVDTKPWVLQGTHIRSQRVTTDSHAGVACLEVNASGKGDALVNKIEVDTRPAMTRGPYDVSLWARWIRGASVMSVHGEYTAGIYGGRPSPAVNLSGNSMAAALRLTVPRNLGTPGAENSVRKRLREASGSDNLGPVIANTQHSPASPAAGLPVTVTARVSDSDGVAKVVARYALNSAKAAFQETELLDDGAHSDGAAGDGLYGGELPGFGARAKVVFHVEATDRKGAVGRFPVDAPAHTCLFMAQGPVKEKLETLRVVLDADRTTELQTRALHSNDLVDGALVFNDSEIYYNIGTRYRGSPWGRPARASYRVRLEDDNRFHRGRKSINLSSRGAAANEGSTYWICSRNSAPNSIAASQDYFYVRYGFNGGGLTTYGLIQPVDRDFVSKWFPGGDDGQLLKCEGRRQLNDGGDLGGMWDGCSYTYRLEEKENYRGYFIPGIRRSIDDWTPFIRLCDVMDRRHSPDAVLDKEIGTILDVEQFLRVLGVRILTADWDAFGVGNGHNGILVYHNGEERWKLLPFDVDNTYSNANPALFPTGDVEVARLMARPWVKRLYFQTLADYTSGYWSATTPKPYLTAVQTATGVSTATIQSYLGTVSRNVQNTIKTTVTIPFKVITGDGQRSIVDGTTIVIEGDAPLAVFSIQHAVDGGEAKNLEPTWTTPTRWRASFDLTKSSTDFDFVGVDREGNVVAEAHFTAISKAFGGVFSRGDVDGDGKLSITDPIVTLRYLFQGGTVDCLDACDADDDGKVNLTDPLVALDHLFREGPPLAAPFPEPGSDPTQDDLDCAR